MRNNWRVENTNNLLVGADGNQLQTKGVIIAKIELTINRVTKTKIHKVAVVKNLTAPMLLRLGLMKMFELNINTSQLEVTFKKSSIEKGIRTLREEKLAPHTVNIITAKAYANGLIMAKPYNFGSSTLIGNIISDVVNNITNVLLINNGKKPVYIKENTQIASFERMEGKPSESLILLPKAVNNVIQLEGSQEFLKIGNQLTDNQVRELKAVIYKNIKAFSINGEIGLTNLAKHQIELLPNAKPFAEPLWRRAPLHI